MDEEQDERKAKKRKKLLDERAKAEKKGVCYLSRIPPHLKPLKLRHLLSQHAEILRLYLVPEDPAARRRRKRAGGNTGKNFTEGWVEFAQKSDAKRVAAMLNGEPMGGKRRSAYYYDLWNIKYLRKFKWDNLTEEIAYKNAIHEQKLSAEISAAKRERDFYLARVEQSRGVQSMERKRKLSEDKTVSERKVLRKFPQKKSVVHSGADIAAAPRLASATLAGVFARKTDVGGKILSVQSS